MDPQTSFNNLAAINRRSDRMVSMRMRGMQTTSNSNATWNIIENDEPENDVGIGGFQKSRSRLMQSRGLAMMKKGSQLQHPQLGNAKFGNPKLGSSSSKSSLLRRNYSGTMPNSSAQRRNSSSTKYSYKLRNILQTDLKMGDGIISSTRTTPTPQTQVSSPTPTKLTTSLSTSSPLSDSSQHRRKIRRTGSLHAQFSQDMQSLLKTLQSDEFVGTIHPQYHARYVSDESLME
jgi:hypothetical protein